VYEGIVTLRGDYAGYRDASIRYRFRFCDDGKYFYVAERADDEFVLWQLAHRGLWRTSKSSHPRDSHTSLTVLQLQPEYMEVTPKEREAIPMLKERALPTDRLEKYLVGSPQLDRAPQRNRRTYYCTVPDPRGGLDATSWHIEPM